MGKANDSEKALTTKLAEYPALMRDPEELRDVIQANVGSGADVTAFDLERIKLPTGGALQWQMPDGSSAASFEGIVAAWQNCRAYWEGGFGGGEPPACSSPDGLTGYGDPGGACLTCPLAQFRTAIGADGEPAAGQACKAMRRLFLLRESLLLPQLLTLGPTSLRPCRQYFVRLVSKQLPYWSVLTGFGLQGATNRANIRYAVAQLSDVARLSDEQARLVREYARAIGGFLSAPVTTADYGAEDNEGGVDL